MAVKTYKNLQDEVLAWLDEVGDTGTTRTLVQNGLNNANRLRATQERWTWMKWDSPVTFSTVIGKEVYPLHQEFFRPYYFWNQTQADFIQEHNDSTLASSRTDPNVDTGPALKFKVLGRTEVQNQPLAASVIAVTSSNGADNGAVSVTLRGDTVDGVRSETITAGSSGTVSFTKILKVTKVGTWVGTMTLTSDSGTTTVLKLFPEEAGRSYLQIQFLAAPSEIDIVEYGFYRQPYTMSADNDRPDVPTPFEDLLVWDTLLAFAAYNQYDPTVVALWQRKQADTLLAMQQAEDARPLEAATNYTSYVPR